MTNKEQLSADLRAQGVEFKETDTDISICSKNWITNYYFHPDGSLDGIGRGNLAAIQKLELYTEKP